MVFLFLLNSLIPVLVFLFMQAPGQLNLNKSARNQRTLLKCKTPCFWSMQKPHKTKQKESKQTPGFGLWSQQCSGWEVTIRGVEMKLQNPQYLQYNTRYQAVSIRGWLYPELAGGNGTLCDSLVISPPAQPKSRLTGRIHGAPTVRSWAPGAGSPPWR